MARQAQDRVHVRINTARSAGWDHQLNSERAQGPSCVIGWSLPDNFDTHPIRPGCDSGELLNIDENDQQKRRNRWGSHLFVVVDGRAVLHDIFLGGGNTFSDSHSVTREFSNGETMIGMAIHDNSLPSIYDYVQRSKEFEEQEKAPGFGAIKVSYVY